MLSSLGSHAKELKQHGAVEAAQDENSRVTAEDAEKVLIDESKKGGAAAFQFDPDASPAEKAAQAGAVSILMCPSLPASSLTCYLTADSPWIPSREEVWSRHRN
jgi:hypothetical protein